MSCEDFTKYRIFLNSFANSSDDKWNIKYGSYTVEESEIVAEAINWTLQYLFEGQCPSSLITPIVRYVASEVQNKERKSPTIDEFDFNSNKYKACDIKRLVFELLKEYCLKLTDNVELNKLLTLKEVSCNDFSSTYSIASIKNTRRTMEDRYICIDDFHGTYNVQSIHQKVHFYGVFDGHDGYNAACYGASHLPFNIAKDSAYPSNVFDALHKSFKATDHNFIKKNIKSGTTALCALHYPEESKLYIAWVGDSKALLVKKQKILQLVIPHKPNIKEEAQRIINQGGSIMPWGGTLRVKGLLNLSRALGDLCCKPFVISDPDIKCIELDNEEDFLILASDGLWDHIEEENAARAVYDYMKTKEESFLSVANHLIELAKQRGSSDNITVIVVFLKKISLINKISNNQTITTAAISKNIINMDTFSNRYTGDFSLDNTTQNLVPNANTELDIKTADLEKDIFQKDTLFNDGLNNIVDPQQNLNDTNNPFITTTTTNFDTNNDIILENKNNIDITSSFTGTEFDDNNRHHHHQHHHHNNHNQYQNENEQEHNNHNIIIDNNELQKFNNDDKLSEMDMGPETSVDITDDVMMMATENSETTDLFDHSALSHSKETLPSSDNINPFDIKNSLLDFVGTVEEVQNLEELSNRTSPYDEDSSPIQEIMTTTITTTEEAITTELIETPSGNTELLIKNDDEEHENNKINDNNIEYNRINDEMNNVQNQNIDMLTDKFDMMNVNEKKESEELLFENEYEKETVIEKDTVFEKDEKDEIKEKDDDEYKEEKVTLELQDNQLIKGDIITEKFCSDIMEMKNEENHATENNEYNYEDHDYAINNNENIENDNNDLNECNNKENEYFSDRDNDFVADNIKINTEMISEIDNTVKIDNDNLLSSVHDLDNKSFDEKLISTFNDGNDNIQKEDYIHREETQNIINNTNDDIHDKDENSNKFEINEYEKEYTEILDEANKFELEEHEKKTIEILDEPNKFEINEDEKETMEILDESNKFEMNEHEKESREILDEPNKFEMNEHKKEYTEFSDESNKFEMNEHEKEPTEILNESNKFEINEHEKEHTEISDEPNAFEINEHEKETMEILDEPNKFEINEHEKEPMEILDEPNKFEINEHEKEPTEISAESNKFEINEHEKEPTEISDESNKFEINENEKETMEILGEPNKFEINELEKETMEILNQKIIQNEQLQSFDTIGGQYQQYQNYMCEINEMKQQQLFPEQEKETYQQQSVLIDENILTTGDSKNVPEEENKVPENLSTGGLINDSCDNSEDEWNYMKLKEGVGEKDIILEEKHLEIEVLEKSNQSINEMSRKLNPEAKEFLPSSPGVTDLTANNFRNQNNVNDNYDALSLNDSLTEREEIIMSKIVSQDVRILHFGGSFISSDQDEIVAQSPRRLIVNMEDDTSLPDEEEFQKEIDLCPRDTSLNNNDVGETKEVILMAEDNLANEEKIALANEIIDDIIKEAESEEKNLDVINEKPKEEEEEEKKKEEQKSGKKEEQKTEKENIIKKVVKKVIKKVTKDDTKKSDENEKDGKKVITGIKKNVIKKVSTADQNMTEDHENNPTISEEGNKAAGGVSNKLASDDKDNKKDKTSPNPKELTVGAKKQNIKKPLGPVPAPRPGLRPTSRLAPNPITKPAPKPTAQPKTSKSPKMPKTSERTKNSTQSPTKDEAQQSFKPLLRPPGTGKQPYTGQSNPRSPGPRQSDPRQPPKRLQGPSSTKTKKEEQSSTKTKKEEQSSIKTKKEEQSSIKTKKEEQSSTKTKKEEQSSTKTKKEEQSSTKTKNEEQKIVFKAGTRNPRPRPSGPQHTTPSLKSVTKTQTTAQLTTTTAKSIATSNKSGIQTKPSLTKTQLGATAKTTQPKSVNNNQQRLKQISKSSASPKDVRQTEVNKKTSIKNITNAEAEKMTTENLPEFDDTIVGETSNALQEYEINHNSSSQAPPQTITITETTTEIHQEKSNDNNLDYDDDDANDI